MSPAIRYARNLSGAGQIAGHLQDCDSAFQPPLSSRVDLPAYAAKLGRHAVRFEAWRGDLLIGLVAAYCDGQDGQPGFISNVSVLPAWTGQGIASRLLADCLAYAAGAGLARLDLEVGQDNHAALALYRKHGFHPRQQAGDSILMSRNPGNGAHNEQ
ncbi:GNAT family N-acetyltransferase [Massilia sp. MB5]|uniref:GNAT family N-acetyltransferase n=1 Tax=Massilia sp. MB5 TaxID=2919578 RepID=UPI001F0EDA59|nr:GNAT family N-acetyltransferase [Massilia sp. MB5]UMR29862.1 GNAT family N-acetyltransferase [Massilia sp. MB5]